MRPEASIVYEAFSYQCIQPKCLRGRSVERLLVYAAFSY
jgi:hypothetical protein